MVLGAVLVYRGITFTSSMGWVFLIIIIIITCDVSGVLIDIINNCRLYDFLTHDIRDVLIDTIHKINNGVLCSFFTSKTCAIQIIADYRKSYALKT